MKGDKKKGDSEESPNEKERVDEFVNEWCRLYRETSQALARIISEREQVKITVSVSKKEKAA